MISEASSKDLEPYFASLMKEHYLRTSMVYSINRDKSRRVTQEQAFMISRPSNILVTACWYNMHSQGAYGIRRLLILSSYLVPIISPVI